MVTKNIREDDAYLAAKLAVIERELAAVKKHVGKGAEKKRSKFIRDPRGMMTGRVDLEDIKAVRRELLGKNADE